MSTQGSKPVGATTPLHAAARTAAASCHASPPTGGHRVLIIGGGGATYAQALGAPSPDRLAEATRESCVHAGHRPIPGAGRPIDPALLALVGLLGDAQPPTQPLAPSAKTLGQLATLLAVVTSRLAALLPDRGAATGGGPDHPATDARPTDAPTLVPPRVPLQPPPPTLTMDPTLGIIVEVEPGALDGAAGSVMGDDSDDRPMIPSSWVPIAGFGRVLDGTRDGIRGIGARIDELLAARGLTRWHLLLLMLAAPVIVVFLIDVVSTMLAGG